MKHWEDVSDLEQRKLGLMLGTVRCDCEPPEGHPVTPDAEGQYTGLPGVLLNGERCDICERYPDDAMARAAREAEANTVDGERDPNGEYIYSVEIDAAVGLTIPPGHPELLESLIENLAERIRLEPHSVLKVTLLDVHAI